MTFDEQATELRRVSQDLGWAWVDNRESCGICYASKSDGNGNSMEVRARDRYGGWVFTATIKAHAFGRVIGESQDFQKLNKALLFFGIDIRQRDGVVR